MSDPESNRPSKNHWLSLAEQLGAAPPPEPPPAPEPVVPPPPPRVAKKKAPAAAPADPKQRKSHWSRLTKLLGIETGEREDESIVEPDVDDVSAAAAEDAPGSHGGDRTVGPRDVDTASRTTLAGETEEARTSWEDFSVRRVETAPDAARADSSLNTDRGTWTARDSARDEVADQPSGARGSWYDREETTSGEPENSETFTFDTRRSDRTTDTVDTFRQPYDDVIGHEYIDEPAEAPPGSVHEEDWEESDDESGDTAPSEGRRRRRRSRRRRGRKGRREGVDIGSRAESDAADGAPHEGDRSAGWHDDGDDDDEAEDAFGTTSSGRGDRSRGRSRLETRHRDADRADDLVDDRYVSERVGAPDDLDDDDDHDDADSARPKHSKIPTWEQAVGLIIEANKANRTRSQHGDSRRRGRGHRR